MAKLILVSSETPLLQDGLKWKKKSCEVVTGQNSDLEDPESCTGATIISTHSSDLAKLNPKCRINYSNYLY